MEGEQGTKGRPRRRRTGSHQALKHGFYSRWFRSAEIADLELPDGLTVRDDIDMLRVVMRRLFELVSEGEPDAETLSTALAAMGKVAFHIGSLLRAEKALAEEKADIAAALSQALNGVLEE
ncbi:MAG TPA: hypothetical protein VF813_07770, partial [Anaerolineaceae bacterium]